jgi:hypothetical protein
VRWALFFLRPVDRRCCDAENSHNRYSSAVARSRISCDFSEARCMGRVRQERFSKWLRATSCIPDLGSHTHCAGQMDLPNRNVHLFRATSPTERELCGPKLHCTFSKGSLSQEAMEHRALRRSSLGLPQCSQYFLEVLTLTVKIVFYGIGRCRHWLLVNRRPITREMPTPT